MVGIKNKKMYTKLDQEIINILCCPLCKGSLEMVGDKFFCKDCANQYPLHDVQQEKEKEGVFDFRIYRPDYCITAGFAKWFDVQSDYEEGYFERDIKPDNLEEYQREINFVKEIYDKEFDIKGRVLDVGGGEGKLRHFIKKNEVSLYISVDPIINGFENFRLRKNLLKAYPRLAEPCNFLSCYSEHLPFKANIFDCVHMKSVLDHFQDPYIAIKEVYRVLKPKGILIISSTTYGGKSFSKIEDRDIFWRRLISDAVYKFRIYGFKSLIEAIIKKLFNKKGWATTHIINWRYEDLIDLLRKTNFSIQKEYWQKPPFDMIVWIEAKKLT